jgi:hypothetical protein
MDANDLPFAALAEGATSAACCSVAGLWRIVKMRSGALIVASRPQ